MNVHECLSIFAFKIIKLCLRKKDNKDTKG